MSTTIFPHPSTVILVWLSKAKQIIQTKLIPPLPYFETHLLVNIIICIKVLVQQSNSNAFLYHVAGYS